MAATYDEEYDSSEYCTATSSEDEEENIQYVKPRIYVNQAAEGRVNNFLL